MNKNDNYIILKQLKKNPNYINYNNSQFAYNNYFPFMPDVCKKCPNNIYNGGNGICNCYLGNLLFE